MSKPESNDEELLGILATKNLAEVMEAVAKLQAETTFRDIVDTEFDNPDFLGGMTFLIKIIERITMHAIAAGPGMRLELGSPELAGFIGHLVLTFTGDLGDQMVDRSLHWPHEGINVIAWGELRAR